MVACIPPSSSVASSAHSSSSTHRWASEPGPGASPLLGPCTLPRCSWPVSLFYLYAEISQMDISSPSKSFESTRPTDLSASLISPLESPPDLKINMPKTDLGCPPPSTCFCSPTPYSESHTALYPRAQTKVIIIILYFLNFLNG